MDKTESAAPETYEDLQVPGDIQPDETDLGDFVSLTKDMDLTPGQAQKLLDFGGAKFKTFIEAPYKAWAERLQAWEMQVKVDPEIGGRNFARNVAEARQVFVPGPSNPLVSSAEEAHALKLALLHTGAGSNPAFVRLFINAARFMQVRATQMKFDKLYPEMNG